MARKQNAVQSTKSKQQANAAAKNFIDDDTDDITEDFDDISMVFAAQDSNSRQLAVRRRLEQYLEEKQLRQQIDDDFADLI
jgi:hypothetical protein